MANRNQDLVSIGNDRLDFILGGGLAPGTFYLVEGDPGVGKSTLALQFALEGVANGESCLYLSLTESKADLARIALSHGWSLDGIELAELSPGISEFAADDIPSMYHSSEIELGEATKAIISHVERAQPQRIVIDSLAEIRHLSQTNSRYRRQLVGLKHYFRGANSTVLLLDDRQDQPDLQLQGVARGAMRLERHSPPYGRIRRRLQVTKMRGQIILTGYHDFTIETGGLKVFPRLIAAEHRRDFEHDVFSSSLPQLDEMLGGGIQRGTSTLLMGSAGTGKSSLASWYAQAAVHRGERAAIFLFDETAGNFLYRSQGLGMQLQESRDAGDLLLRQVDSAALSPGEFSWEVREAVEDKGVSLIIIDSVNGLLNSMPDELYLKGHLHELLSYLSQLGATTILTLSQHGLLGDEVESSIETSYLADSIVLLRFFEYAGEVRKAISVVKKRTGGHETSVRELGFSNLGVRIGEPLREFQGVLTGEPKYIGGADPLFGDFE